MVASVSNDLEAYFVLLGSTGMTGLEGSPIGNVSQNVLLYAVRPVLMVGEP